MIKREYLVVLKQANNIISIEAQCDTIKNAELFINENQYILKENSNCEFQIQDIVIIKDKE